jgi:hypothetical protein
VAHPLIWLLEIKSMLILQPGPAALTDGLDALVAIVEEWRRQAGWAPESARARQPNDGHSIVGTFRLRSRDIPTRITHAYMPASQVAGVQIVRRNA